jgi:hypothetical protein
VFRNVTVLIPKSFDIGRNEMADLGLQGAFFIDDDDDV